MDITLALSGGGIKGFAHIGALRVLEKEGYHIRGIAGTSSGGMIGALYASGHSPDEIQERLSVVNQGTLYTRMHGDGPALLGFNGVANVLREMLGELTFADLRFPLAITATDLTSGKPVVVKTGKVLDAAIATAAVPGVFPPVVFEEHVLVDGAVINPIPVDEARALYPKAPVVAIVLSPPVGWKQEVEQATFENTSVYMANIPLIYRWASRLRLAQALNIFLLALDVGGYALMEKQLELEHPDVIVRPDVPIIGILDHVDVAKMAKIGERATQEMLPEIHRVTSWQYHLRMKAAQLIAPR